jgi:hypothetical protein
MKVSVALETCPTVGISPRMVVCVVPVGAGEGDPPVGISPAKAGPEKTHAKAIVIKNRFMDVSLL